MARKNIYEGQIRNKERTKCKLIDAVGDIIRTKGYSGLGLNAIAKQAGCAPVIITNYFGSVDNLVETYIKGKDYWMSLAAIAADTVEKNPEDNGRTLTGVILDNLLDFFYSDSEMQNIVLWQFSQANPIMDDVCQIREQLGSLQFQHTDVYLHDTNVDLRAIVALCIGGIYGLVLHSQHMKSTFCEIDLNTPDGMDRIKSGLASIVNSAFDEAKRQKEEQGGVSIT
jgi:AcrR family transcriptional regulator